MKTRQRLQLVRIVLAGIALVYIFLFLYIAFRRMAYPYELEFMEGGSLVQMLRLLQGKPLYAEPSLDYTALLYPPLYFYVGAWISKILSPGFLPLRLLSIAASCSSMILVSLWVKQLTSCRYYAFLSAGLFAACFYISGAWYDVARVDALFLFLVLLSLYLLYQKKTIPLVLAGLGFVLALMTKQSALIIFFGSAVGLFFTAVPLYRKILYPLCFLILLLPSLLILQTISGQWFLFYTFTLPQQHAFLPAMIFKFWQFDILQHVLVLFGFSILYFIYQYRQSRSEFGFHFMIAAAMIASAWVSRMHAGGYINVLMPAFAIISIYSVAGLALLIQKIQVLENLKIMLCPQKPMLSVSTAQIKAILYGLVLLQFFMLIYDPRDQIPSRADRTAGDLLVQELRTLPGDVYMPWHGYLPLRAGKTYVATHGLFDILRGNDSEIRQALQHQLDHAIAEKRFSAVILDSRWYDEHFLKHYTFDRFVFSDPTVFWPPAGMHLRPEFIYVRKEQK